MSRTVPAGVQSALTASEIEPFYAVEVNLDSGALRLWTGIGDKTIEGSTYTGSGSLIAISGLEEVSDLSAKGITVTLSGLPSSLVSDALAEPYQRREVRVLWGVQSSSDVVEVFSGKLNQMSIEDSADSSSITVSVDSKLVELERADNRRYTSESHKTRNPGDTFFDFVAGIQDKQIQFEPR